MTETTGLAQRHYEQLAIEHRPSIFDGPVYNFHCVCGTRYESHNKEHSCPACGELAPWEEKTELHP